jgi:hypothetical protein
MVSIAHQPRESADGRLIITTKQLYGTKGLANRFIETPAAIRKKVIHIIKNCPTEFFTPSDLVTPDKQAEAEATRNSLTSRLALMKNRYKHHLDGLGKGVSNPTC